MQQKYLDRNFIPDRNIIPVPGNFRTAYSGIPSAEQSAI